MLEKNALKVASFAIQKAPLMQRNYIYAKFFQCMTMLEIPLAISLNKKLADYVIFYESQWQGVKCVYTGHYAKSTYIANLRRNDTVLDCDMVYVLCENDEEYLIPYKEINTGRIYLSNYQQYKLINLNLNGKI